MALNNQTPKNIHTLMNTEIIIPIYYTIDDDGNKVFDLDLMREEFEEQLENLN